ncbi:DNA polymerase I [Argonema antarcticum]|uniref:DNA polymerase I n=1 Tax=Argonema antarcticum TaxID=2942763 RepID=UPI0020120640|nr:DNA polymerase I [Argonema antarcticum]MCL1473036.1 DNA polymerase I [Argonema antarcticum A004/B2]
MSKSTSASPETLPLIVLVDGHSLAFRSYYAFAKGRDGGLKTKTGMPTSVCFGFLKSLLAVIESQKPEAIAIAFDLSLPTFRHEADDTYKADRTETPEDFIADLKNLHELLEAFNLPILTAPGYEADDVLGTLATQASVAGYRVKILTGDKDLFQLVDTNKGISVLYLGKTFLQRNSTTGLAEVEPEQVKDIMGISPEQVVDYKALCGDTSDNIPGVKGIGDKTAVKLLADFGSLDAIYASLDEIKGANKTKLETGKEIAYHSQHLAKIVTDVPLDVSLEDCKLKGFDSAALEPLLETLDFKFYLGKIKELQQAFGGVAAEEKQAEPSGKTLSETSLDSAEFEQLSFFSFEETQAIQQKPDSPITSRIIDTPAKLKELVTQLQSCTDSATPVAWDTETSDLEPRDAELVGIGCCWGTNPDDVAYIPINHKKGENLDKATVLEALRPILESDRYPKALQNAKFDRLVLRCQGIKLSGVVLDTMLASYVLNPENSHSLEKLSERDLELKIRSYTSLVPKDKTIADVNISMVADYCGMQVYATFQLVAKLREKLEIVPALYRLLLEVEEPLEPVLAAMEYDGVRIDIAYLKELSQQMKPQLEAIEKKACNAVPGETFNLNSPEQLSKLLFKTLNLDTKKSRKTAKKGFYSTDVTVLEKLQGDHPVVDAILEYRTLHKLYSTYVEGILKRVRGDTKRLHTDFNQTVTDTGRLSSSNPNLQNIPIGTDFSRRIRKAFLPEDGWLLVSADYSQIELRILAHLSQEPVLVEAYKNNEDIHTVTARLVFEKENITSDERRLAKTINFGVIYGMGSLRFSRSTGVNKANANEFIKRFNDRYPKVFEYLERMKREAIASGYVETIRGRRRYFNFESGSVRSYRGANLDEIDFDKLKKMSASDAQLLRAAANAPIQGSSADIIKIAMIKLHQILQNYQARLVLQVHDELVLEVPPSEWEELQLQIRSTMENAVQLSVPLVVDVHVGPNWMETK